MSDDRADLLSRARVLLDCYNDDQLDRMCRSTLERFGEELTCGKCGGLVYDTPMVGGGRARYEADGSLHPFSCEQKPEPGALPLAPEFGDG